MTMAGFGQRTVQAVLGHRTPQMTMRYSHLSPDFLAGVAHRYGEYLSTEYKEECDTSCDTQAKTGTDVPEGRP